MHLQRAKLFNVSWQDEHGLKRAVREPVTLAAALALARSKLGVGYTNVTIKRKDNDA